ncbi:SDR family oxidoreductase [Alteromonas confluentis]|uniref:Short-chain dehydrogenase n=1 Tax=Alteromonas confluentis TaxID=1656094 RepID=A0A1E7Z7C8_9ALTE|nr:SDR family oxidoreductase [Alteromonas confluentis]OFC69387.1 short-chain dehydrogenase [Alteromonas confluentis]
MSELSKKVTIITGASSGIGKSIAKSVAAKGGTVILAARSEDKLKDLVDKIIAEGGNADFFVTDVTDLDNTKSLVAYTLEKYGRIDHFINNAGLMLFSNWEDVVVDDWQKMININLMGYLNGIASVLPYFVETKCGLILNTSSVAGIHVGKSSGVYSATKFFIRGITESLRKEVGVKYGIRTSMISPGVIDTGWTEKVNDEAGKKVAMEVNDVGIDPKYIGDAVAYALAQPDEVNIFDLVVHPTLQDW